VGIRYIVMRPGIGLCNRRSPRNGSRTYVARRITLSTASEIVVIAATIVTQTKVLVTADAAGTRAPLGVRWGAPGTPESDDAECHEHHPDDVVQVDAVAAAREIKDDDVPAVRVKANYCRPSEDCNHCQGSAQHAETLRGCHRQSASMFAATIPTSRATCGWRSATQAGGISDLEPHPVSARVRGLDGRRSRRPGRVYGHRASRKCARRAWPRSWG
jgi:hypothetical protein